ncbi:lycopene cyclase family protein [Fulvivirgaceae bacterium BMA12]|uniref:Lycopene cyclase family protein n=1 Tax=Agaribacillus aureus TaxID=3051825 RepID=A0ABT8L8T7_9BACT|nr:lycopene cyclase family protein [Fulvivirgaceae bacterium BMA12]
MKQYDYIIAGAGCSGLMLALELTNSRLKDKSVLIIDQEKKNTNDRTWCFWETRENSLEHLVYKSWDVANFYSDDFEQEMDLRPYRYKMIRGIDFYSYVFQQISHYPNFEFLEAKIDEIKTHGEVVTDQGRYQATFVFSSYHLVNTLNIPKSYQTLLQHFKGWVIKTDHDSFDPGKMTYMDFRVAYNRETRFCYVLPFSEKKALIEYTLFTDTLLEDKAYDEALKHYINNQLKIGDYQILEEEFGIIPMSDFPFPQTGGKNVINIGTLGGNTKASTGFTFLRIQKAVKRITKNLADNKYPLSPPSLTSKRFRLYDSTLLNVLANETYPAKDIFTELFKKNGPTKVFKFLDEETNLLEEISIMNLSPKKQFIKAFFQQVLKIHKL